MVETSWQLESEHLEHLFQLGHPAPGQGGAACVDQGEEGNDQIGVKVKDHCDWLRLVGAGDLLEEVGQQRGERGKHGTVGVQSFTPVTRCKMKIGLKKLYYCRNVKIPAQEGDI